MKPANSPLSPLSPTNPEAKCVYKYQLAHTHTQLIAANAYQMQSGKQFRKLTATHLGLIVSFSLDVRVVSATCFWQLKNASEHGGRRWASLPSMPLA